MANGASLVPNLQQSGLLQSLQQFTPAAREERALRLAGLEQGRALGEQQLQMGEAQLAAQQALNRRNQIIDLANQNRVELLKDQSDLSFVLKDGPEGLRNNIALLMRERGGDPEFDTQEVIAYANQAAQDAEGTFKELTNNQDLVNRQLATVDQILSRAQGGQAKIQFGGQNVFKDAKGNLFYGTTRRDPATGEVQSVMSAIDGTGRQPEGRLQQAGTYGLTAQEKVGQIASERTASDRAKANEEARQGFIQQGLAVRSQIPNTKRLIELNELIRTGKLGQAERAFGSLFGTTEANLGEFNARAGQMILGNIRALGANPTEGERTFLQTITPSLEQGRGVNRALLEDLLKVQERQVRRAKWFARNPDATVEQYLLETDEPDFTPTSTVEEGVTTTGDQTQVMTITTQADYDALPSGAVFIENGERYRKP